MLEVKPGGKYRILADRFEGKKFNTPNDVVLGPDGALYFTDPTLDLPKVDRKGNLFVTGPGGLWVWAPDGTHLGTILLPETAANLTWGDADKRSLYITASTSVYRLKVRTRGFVPK